MRYDLTNYIGAVAEAGGGVDRPDDGRRPARGHGGVGPRRVVPVTRAVRKCPRPAAENTQRSSVKGKVLFNNALITFYLT